MVKLSQNQPIKKKTGRLKASRDHRNHRWIVSKNSGNSEGCCTKQNWDTVDGKKSGVHQLIW